MKEKRDIALVSWIILLSVFIPFRESFSMTGFQDAKKEVSILSTGKGSCHGNFLQMAVKNNSRTQKVNIIIVIKDRTQEFTTTSTVKYSGIPPGYLQPIGCGGPAGAADSVLITYSVGAAAYSK